MNDRRIMITCARGVVPILAREIEALGFPVVSCGETAVETKGELVDTYRLNLRLRTGHRVLWLVGEFGANTPDELYARLRAIPWERWIPADGRLCVTSAVSTPSIRDSRFPTLKCKDAIVDRIQQVAGRRPDSGSDRSGAVVFLHWMGSHAAVFLDTSGDALSFRGYRRSAGQAPLRESIAAACVLAGVWDRKSAFVNPMCGSGTIAVEAALLAMNRAPGLLRRHFGCMALKGFDANRWEADRRAAESEPPPATPPRIVATDIDPNMIVLARKNAEAAGVERQIEFSVCDFAETPIPSGGGVVCLNPEYGERMGDAVKLEAEYKRIGDFLKQRCGGTTAYVLTGNLALAKKIGLRSRRRIPIYNGDLECRLIEFELYAGSRRGGEAGGEGAGGGREVEISR